MNIDLSTLAEDFALNASTSLPEHSEKFIDAVKKIADSNLPNSFFLQQFFPPYPEPFCNKKYWYGFAKVVEQRAIANIDSLNDIKEKIFIWLQDLNWPGNEIIQPLIKTHKDYFKQSFGKVIVSAIQEDDCSWAQYIIEIYMELYDTDPENKNELQEICKQLDDCTKYNKSLVLQKLMDIFCDIATDLH